MNDRKLQLGDEVRVIAPSASWSAKRQQSYDRATAVLEDVGFKVSFGKRVAALERFGTAPVADRLADLHDAYGDPKVKAVIALHGGWSANALLPGIDWELIKQNPKPLIGFSDITVLLNAFYAQTGRTNYLGPNFSSLGHVKGGEYSRVCLLDVLTRTGEISLSRSKLWQRERGKALVATRPWKVLGKGKASGTLLGGNLGTFYLLQGTPCQPRFDKPTILAVEDDDEAGKYSAREFDRRLESLLQLPGARENINGLLVGRFQPDSRVSLPDVQYIVNRMALGAIPIIADMDFGHTWPLLTLPIGGKVAIDTTNNQPQVKLLEY